jgi:hypothetical protein
VLFAAVFVEAVAVFGIFPHLAHLIEAPETAPPAISIRVWPRRRSRSPTVSE